VSNPTTPPATTVEGSEAAPPRLHLQFLDGARACAALYVAVYHTFEHTWDFKSGHVPAMWFSLSTFFLQSGRSAVSLFIIISGFCLMLPVLRNNVALTGGALDFLRKRSRRILPPYFLTLAVSMLLMFTLLAQRSNVSLERSLPAAKQWLLYHVLLIQNWRRFFHPHYSELANLDLVDMMTASPERMLEITKLAGDEFPANGPLWSIAVEWQIYFFFPLLVLLWRRIGAGWTTVLAMTLSYSFYLKFHHMAHFLMSPHYLGLFALGMLGANIAYGEGDKWRSWRDKRLWLPLTYVLWAVVLVLNLHPLMAWQYPYLVDLIAGPASLCLLVAASKPGHNRLHSLLSRPTLVFVGTFSYSIYLLHDLLLRVILTHVLVPLTSDRLVQWFLLVTMGVPVLVAVIYLFHLVAERPFMNTKPELRFWKRDSQRPNGK